MCGQHSGLLLVPIWGDPERENLSELDICLSSSVVSCGIQRVTVLPFLGWPVRSVVVGWSFVVVVVFRGCWWCWLFRRLCPVAALFENLNLGCCITGR